MKNKSVKHNILSKRIKAFDAAIGSAIASICIDLIFISTSIIMGQERTFFITAIIAGVLVLNVIFLIMVCLMQRHFKNELENKIAEPIGQVQSALDILTTGDFASPISLEADDRLGKINISIEEIRRTLELYHEQQKRDEESRRIYVNGLMHDIATPITRINGCASMISDSIVTSSEDIKKFAEIILQNTQDINVMLKNLAQIEVYNNDVLQIKRVPIDMSYVIGRYLEDLKAELSSKNIEIEFINLCPKPPVCKIDVRSCKRVFMNLVTNSEKYRNPTGECKIKITLNFSGESELLLSFEDNGIGIPQGTEDKLFEMFYRADSSRHNSSQGNGIGLFVSREILKANGAKIWAEGLEEGLRINVLFPLVNEAPVDWFEEDVKDER